MSTLELQAANAARRAELAGPAGVRGLLKNPRLMRLAAITTLGALCYGYEQGAYSQVLVMDAFVNDPRFSRIANDASFKGWSVSYNSEISPPELRGTVVSIQQLAIVTGICISFWVGYGTNFISTTNSAAWRVCLAGQGIPSLALALLTLTLPYTPRWLIRKGRNAEALRTLAWLRRMPEDSEIVQLEYTEIQAEALFEAETTAERFPKLTSQDAWTQFKLQVAQFGQLFTTVHMFRRTAVACLTQFFQQMTGIDVIVYYAPTIFQSLGLPGRTISLLAAGVIGGRNLLPRSPYITYPDLAVVFIISTLPAIATIDRIGRRPLLLAGGAGMALMLILVAALTATYQPDWKNPAAGWTAAAFIWLYTGFFGASWGPVSWTVISEVFPLSTRAHGVALAASANWITNFVVGVVVPDMLRAITYGTYLFFLVFMLMGMAFAYWILPETFGKSLEEMDLAFGSGEGQEDLARMERILQGLQDKENSKEE
ncbi:Hexose transport-related protein [Mycena kentingensis (nom. inval.)]|nr:Hexose transport-related protein [Mycena kentingensis (nom. inval.)]